MELALAAITEQPQLFLHQHSCVLGATAQSGGTSDAWRIDLPRLLFYNFYHDVPLKTLFQLLRPLYRRVCGLGFIGFVVQGLGLHLD